MDLPGHPRSRVICRECGEGINDGRELDTVDHGPVCQSCAFGAYYQTEPTLNLESSSRKRLEPSIAASKGEKYY